MKKFQSVSAVANSTAEEVYRRCSSFEMLGAMMPEQIVNWSVDGEQCSFDIQGMASLTLVYKEKVPYQKVLITSLKAPFSIELLIEINADLNPDSCSCKTTLWADLNPMLAMLASRSLQHLADIINQKLAA
jgi:hypothetical protein